MLRRSLRRTSGTPRPTFGGCPALRAPPCPSTALGILSLSKDIWTFLSSLGESEFFSILLARIREKARE
jgi:CRISPR/Cas system-associated protein Cas5 (RAMP superfamily)